MTPGVIEPIIAAERSFLCGTRIQLIEDPQRIGNRQRFTQNRQEIELLVALDHGVNDHAQRALELNRTLRIVLPQSLLERYAKQNGLPTFSTALIAFEEGDGLLLHLAHASAALLCEDKNPCVEHVFDSILQAICVQIIRHCDPPGGTTRKGGLTHQHLLRAKRKMLANLGNEIRLREIAAECFMSESHFVRAFKATVGCSPVRWLLEQRIEEAKRLLLSNTMSLKSVAVQCGYTDQAAFTRIFRRRTGTTPSDWRRYRTVLRDDFTMESYTLYCG